MNKKGATALSNIQPIGLGTPMAESLESYAERVAEAHRVPRYFLDALLEGDSLSLTRPKRAAKPTCLNTPSPTAQRYTERLAELTAMPAVRSLGLGVFSGALSQINVNRQSKAWCDECFSEWNAAGNLLYWPQLWSFPQYTVCHRHNIPLCSKCRRCGAGFPSDRPWKGGLGQCTRCKSDLYERSSTATPSAGPSSRVYRRIPDYAELAAHALGDLVAHIQRITLECLEVGTQFSVLMAHCQKYDLANRPSDLARIAGLSRPTIHNLEHNEHAPCLGNLLRIAVACEVSVAGLLCADLWETTATGLKVEARTVQLPDLTKRVYYDWDAIEKQVITSIEAGTAEVPWAMARSMGLCEKQFCLKLGKTVYRLRCAALNIKHSGKAGEYEDIKWRLTEEVDVAMANRQRKGRKSMAMKLKIGIHNPMFVRAHKEVLSAIRKPRRRYI